MATNQDESYKYFWSTKWMRNLYVLHPNAFSIAAASLPVIITAVVSFLGLNSIGKAFLPPYNFTADLGKIDGFRVFTVVIVLLLSYLFIASQYVRIREDRAEKTARYRLEVLTPSIEWVLSENRRQENFAIAGLRPYFAKIDTFDISEFSDVDYLKGEFDLVSETLEMVLATLISTAKTYSLASTKGVQSDVFGGSFMIAIPRENISQLNPSYKVIRDAVRLDGTIRFSNSLEQALTSEYLLVLPHSLRLKSNMLSPAQLKDSKPKLDPIMILPVNHRNDGKLVLPGAPEAMLHGGLSSHRDMRSFRSIDNFDAVIRDQLKSYFSSNGEGAEVRSIFSYRIEDSRLVADLYGEDEVRVTSKPVGVLSLDSSDKDMFGSDDKQYTLFSAMLSRILPSIAPALDYYSRLWLLLQQEESVKNEDQEYP